MSLYSQYDYAIVNDGLDECVESILAVIRSARCRTSRLTDTALRIMSTFQTTKER
jgi:guanylate kinase